MKKNISLDEAKKIMLEILKVFIEFCESNNLRYSLDGGTLLGSIRHNGFIPWDDDIDVMMPIDDYNFFINNFKHEKYKVLNNESDRFWYSPISKLVDSNTFCREANYKKIKKLGIFIDIFPLEFIPEDEFLFYLNSFYNKKINDKLLLINSRKYWYCNNYIVNKQTFLLDLFLLPYSIIRAILLRNIIGFRYYFKKMKKKYLSMSTLNKFLVNDKNFDEKTKKFRCSDKKLAFMHWGDFRYSFALNIDDFDNCEYKMFENIKCKVIRSYDAYLRAFYKCDYMQIPPEEERNTNHGLEFWYKDKK